MLIEGFLHVFFFDRWIYDLEHRSSSHHRAGGVLATGRITRPISLLLSLTRLPSGNIETISTSTLTKCWSKTACLLVCNSFNAA